MSQHFALSHHTRANFSLSGNEDKIYLRAPAVHRNFIGKRSVGLSFYLTLALNLILLMRMLGIGAESQWMVSDSKTIEGTLNYEDIRYISGPARAIAEIVVRKLVVEFKSWKPDEDTEVVVAIFKSDDDVEAMVTTTSDGNWQAL
ncbi:hypothetical protein B0J17DRAFT_720384 [Rhizoctonia solani]|nr:hypothetical protein B0J17DRAFT_720384 [Rhizoctonia solani]